MKENAVIIKKEVINPELFIVQFRPEGWERPDFTPGQFCTLGLPGAAPRIAEAKPEAKPVNPDQWIKRAYSIASSPNEKGNIEIFVALVREGALTPRLMNLKAGDKLFMGPKITGHFTCEDVPPDNHFIFFATGTGLAPYISMARTYLPQKKFRSITIVHGVRHTYDLAYADELKAYTQRHDNFHYFPVVSRSQQENKPWDGLKGHVQQAAWEPGHIEKTIGEKLTPKNTHMYLCGSPAMIDEFVKLLEKDGFKEHSTKAPGNVHVERYW